MLRSFLLAWFFGFILFLFYKSPQHSYFTVQTFWEIKPIFFSHSQLKKVIIQTFFWYSYNFSSLLQIQFFTLRGWAWCMHISPSLYKLYNLSNASLPTSLFFILFTLHLLFWFALLLVVFNHDDVELEVFPRD